MSKDGSDIADDRSLASWQLCPAADDTFSIMSMSSHVAATVDGVPTFIGPATRASNDSPINSFGDSPASPNHEPAAGGSNQFVSVCVTHVQDEADLRLLSSDPAAAPVREYMEDYTPHWSEIHPFRDPIEDALNARSMSGSVSVCAELGVIKVEASCSSSPSHAANNAIVINALLHAERRSNDGHKGPWNPEPGDPAALRIFGPLAHSTHDQPHEAADTSQPQAATRPIYEKLELMNNGTVVWTADDATLGKVNGGELTFDKVKELWQERDRVNLSQPQAAVPKASSAPPSTLSEQPANCNAVTYVGTQSELGGYRHCTNILIF